jgi:hypothetical protein
MNNKMKLILCFLVLTTAGFARGEMVTLNHTFSGTDPVGNQPWVEIVVSQLTSKSVKFTVNVPSQTQDLSQSEFVDKVYLNVDPSLNIGNLSFAYDSGIQNSSHTISTDGPKADGDGYYDILVDYPNANNTGARLTTGTSSSFVISSTSAISVNSFNYSSVNGGGNGTYYAAAHVDAIPPGSASGWVGASSPYVVPEPSTLILLGIASLGVFAGVWRKRSVG